MKNAFLALCLLIFIFSGCVSTGNVNYTETGDLIVYNSDSVKNSFEKINCFTNQNHSDNFYTVDYLIGKTIEDNLSHGIFVERLPSNLKSKKTVLIVNRAKTEILYYVKDDGKHYIEYAFDLILNNDQIDLYYQYGLDYDLNFSNGAYWKSKSDIALQPLLDKTRKVPYTAYRTVSKSRPVTKYRRTSQCINGQMIWYDEPYTDYEYYTVNEPYTAYRTETYQVTNPDYNPQLSEKYLTTANEYFSLAKEIQCKMGLLNLYDLSFKN